MSLIALQTFFSPDRLIAEGDVVADTDPVVAGREHLFGRASRGDQLSPIVVWTHRPVDPTPDEVSASRRRRRKASTDETAIVVPPAEAAVDDPRSLRPPSAPRNKTKPVAVGPAADGDVEGESAVEGE